MPKLSVIIPCLNEEKNVEKILGKISGVMHGCTSDYEIVIVDDQSDDGTLDLATRWAAANQVSCRVLHKELHRRGYGAAVKYGLAHALGDYAIFVSADCVDPIELIPAMYNALNSGFDLVQVSRYIDKGNSSTIPWTYKGFQMIYRLCVYFAIGDWIPDSTYAFKMFVRSKVLSTGLASNRFNISPEIMFKSILAGWRIKFISGAQGIRTDGVSKFKFHKEGFGFGVCLMRAFLHRKKIVFWF